MPNSPGGKILVALRKRMTAENYNVYLGRDIDTDSDTLPAVSIFHHKDGDTVTVQHPRLTQEMNLIVECWLEGGDDPLLKCYEFAHGLRQVVAPGRTTDLPDYLGGLAQKVEYMQTLSITRDRKYATAQLRLSITY